MNLRQKIILFAIAPLVVALCAISLAVSYQADALVEQEREVIKTTYIKTKENELKNYVALAMRAISHLYESGRNDAATQDAAKAILERLEYSADGYFFLYRFDGTLLSHSKMKDQVGTNMLHRLDENGKPLIRDFINIAREKRDDFFYDYVWEKYSTGNTAKIPKRAYVIGLPKWGWVLGTGVYMDDIDAALAEADKKASTNITRTMLWIFAITGLSLLIVISLGLALNIREQRDTLEKERERFAGELHEGIAQQVDAIKNHIETDILKLTNSSQEESSETLGMLEEMVERLYEVNGEIRRIAHGLYPEILTDLGLEKALRQLTHDYPSAHFTSEGEVNGLPERVALALYRTAQAALDNVYKHANARKIIVRLEGDEHYVTLIINDDGNGFNVESHLGALCDRIGVGIGLRNMKRRIENENGKLDIASSPEGTTVTAKVLRKSLSIFLTNLFPWKSK